MIDIGYEKIFQKGKIRIESTLDHGFYNYMSGSETLAFDRIAEALYNLGNDADSQFGGIYITLSSVVPVGFEITAARIPNWLVLDVVATSKIYEDPDVFGNLMTLTAEKAMLRLVTKGLKKAVVEIGDEYYTVIDSD